eukprot:TRINITY_DN78841_c0_g1_i1.p1 TRINITY_DN78841_c0_g1~~TRINITY_DN78841_c0_g1_i1.p1  ORF type:complete len:714 (-),score=151.69 TRINITY_DN78841_c0_g1_i1:49-2190(-)
MGYRMGGPWGSEGTKKKMQILAQKDEGRFMTSYHKTFNSPAVPQSSMVMGPASSSMVMSVPGNVFNKSLRSQQMGRSISTGALQLAGRTMAVKEELKESISPAKAMSPMASMPSTMTASLLDPPGKALPPLMMKSYMNREMRRKCLETLASPNIGDIAKEIFKAHDKDGSGTLDVTEILGLLQQMHDQLDLPEVDARQVESLLKKFGSNKDHTLGVKEFFELFKAQLRRTAFDRGSVLGREFFLTKSDQDVWSVYQKVKELGAGSFGTAYLGKQKASGDQYVVKAVKKSRTLLPLDEIEQEVLIMRQVDHPHVVRLFEWYEDSNRIYLILEFLRGGTVKDVVLQLQQKEQRGLKEAWIRTVLEQCAGAMAYCHSLRLIHKDIKDENIMLLKQESGWDKPHAVIIDLGIAEMFSVADPSGRMLGGTPTTMAPEVWQGSFGPKCDVWSLGCVFYQLCAGSYPFMARSVTPSAWMRLHKRGPKYDAMKTSGDSRDLCQAMLTYHEQDRPTMLDVLSFEYFKKASHQLTMVPAENFGPFLAVCKMHAARQGLLLEIAARLPFSKSSEIINLFSEVDTDHSGTIGRKELVDYFAKIGIHDQELVQETFNVLDVDKDGALSFSEFASGALLLFKDTLEDQLYSIFSRYDSEGSGVLTSKQADAFLANVQSMTDLKGHSQAEQFLQSGKITFAQLRDYLLGPMSASSKPSTARSSQRSFR